jgi:hypothetical protein
VTLPWSWYSDPQTLPREQKRIFRRAWQYAGTRGPTTSKAACELPRAPSASPASSSKGPASSGSASRPGDRSSSSTPTRRPHRSPTPSGPFRSTWRRAGSTSTHSASIGRTAGWFDYYFSEEVSDAEAEELIAFDDQVGAEDRRLVESVQLCIGSGLLDSGQLLPENERLLAHFQQLVREALA